MPTRFCAAITTLLVLTSALATAKPAWLNELTSPQPGKHAPLPAGTMEFEISWKGILQSGRLEMELGQSGAHKQNARVVKCRAESLGLASGFFPYNGTSWSEHHPATLHPRLFSAWERNKDETIKTDTRFLANGIQCREETRVLGRPTTQVEEHLFPYQPAYDISSALLHIRSQKLDQGDPITLLIHPFNNPYLLRAKVLGREIHEGRPAILLSVEMQKINRDTLELRPYKKLKKPAQLWISDDNLRLPLELRAQIFIGDIHATLARFRQP